MWSYSENVYEGASEEREEDVEKKSRVRFKTENTSADAKEGGCEIVEGCEGLRIVHHRLLHNRAYLHFSFRKHDDDIVTAIAM